MELSTRSIRRGSGYLLTFLRIKNGFRSCAHTWDYVGGAGGIAWSHLPA